MDPGLDRLPALLAATLAAATAALIRAIPGADFVLQAAGLGSLAGTAMAYWQKRRDPTIDVARIIATITVTFAAFAIMLQLLSLVL